MESTEDFQTFAYHCICSHLVLASTTPLEDLDRRSGDSIGREYILPLTLSSNVMRAVTSGSIARNENTRDHYAILLSTFTDRKAKIVARSDGFEKRWVQRCGRCKSVIGYQLDHEQSRSSDPEKFGRKEDIVYILAGSLQTTKEMMEAEVD